MSDGPDDDPAVTLVAVVLDTTDARRLAEFYRRLLGFEYDPGHAPPPPGSSDPKGEEWLVLHDPRGSMRLSFQQVAELPSATWPSGPVPQQLHLDLTVTGHDELRRQQVVVEEMGGVVLDDRSDDDADPLVVFADPDGHPFCIIVVGRGSD